MAAFVAVAHWTNDCYASFLSPLLPRLMGKLGLSIALAATLATALSLASSVLQPFLGYLADRYGRKPFVALGPLLSGVFLSLIGLAPSFIVLITLLVLGGLGSAAFHPPGASMAARVEEGKGSGLRLSIFTFSGTLGYAVGPLVAVGLVAKMGLEGMWIAMFPGIAVAALLFWVLPSARAEGPPRPPPSPGLVIRRLRGPLGSIFAISAISAFVQRVFITMDPIVVAEQGGSEALGGVILSVYLTCQAIGTLAGGVLADRMDRRALLIGLTALALPAHLVAVWMAPGSVPGLVSTGLAGFLNLAMLPPIVVWAQEMLPEGAAVSSGIVMGLAWAVGSVGVLASGVLGDLVGAQGALLLSLPVLLLGTLFASDPRLRVSVETARPGNRNRGDIG